MRSWNESSTRPWRKTGTCVTSTLLKLAQTCSGLDETRRVAAVPRRFEHAARGTESSTSREEEPLENRSSHRSLACRGADWGSTIFSFASGQATSRKGHHCSGRFCQHHW